DGRRLGTAIAGSAGALLLLLLGFVVFFLVVVVLFVAGEDQIARVKKRALLRADVDEGSLDAGKHGVHFSQIDVPNHAAVVGTVDHQLDELVILQDGHASLSRTRVDVDISFHAGSRRVGRAATLHPAFGNGSRWKVNRRAEQARARGRSGLLPARAAPRPHGARSSMAPPTRARQGTRCSSLRGAPAAPARGTYEGSCD